MSNTCNGPSSQISVFYNRPICKPASLVRINPVFDQYNLYTSKLVQVEPDLSIKLFIYVQYKKCFSFATRF